MTVLSAQQFNNGPNGAPLVLPANEAIGQSGAGSVTYSALLPVTGAFSARAQAGPAEFAFWASKFTAATSAWARVLWTTPVAAPGAAVFLAGFNLGNVGAMDIRLNVDMTVTLRDRAALSSIARWTSPVLPFGTRLRMAWRCAPGSATGLQLRLYVGETDLAAATPTYDSAGQLSTSSLTTVDQIHVGVLYATTAGVSLEFDAVSVETVEPAAAAVNPLVIITDPPPVVDLGSAVTVMPGTATVLLTAVGSDSGGGPVTYRWRVVEPNPPAMTGSSDTRLVTSPILRFDQAWTFGVTAIDSSSQASAEALAVVTFLATTEWHCTDSLQLVPFVFVNADGAQPAALTPGAAVYPTTTLMPAA